MSGHPPAKTRHFARSDAPSAWRPVLTLCGRKINPERIVRSADEAAGYHLCPQCIEVQNRATMRPLLRFASGVKSERSR